MQLDTRQEPCSLWRPHRHCGLPRFGVGFDEAIVEFANQYANQNESDYKQFVDAIGSGRLEADESR
jgi:hypothetical protein